MTGFDYVQEKLIVHNLRLLAALRAGGSPSIDRVRCIAAAFACFPAPHLPDPASHMNFLLHYSLYPAMFQQLFWRWPLGTVMRKASRQLSVSGALLECELNLAYACLIKSFISGDHFIPESSSSSNLGV